jgi:hypothetical protein
LVFAYQHIFSRSVDGIRADAIGLESRATKLIRADAIGLESRATKLPAPTQQATQTHTTKATSFKSPNNETPKA